MPIIMVAGIIRHDFFHDTMWDNLHCLTLTLSLGGQGLYPSDLLTHEVPHRLPLRQVYQVNPHHQVPPMGYAILWILWLYDLDNNTNVDTTSTYGWVALHHCWFHIVLHNILPFCSMWFCWCFSASEEWILVSVRCRKCLYLSNFTSSLAKLEHILAAIPPAILGKFPEIYQNLLWFVFITKRVLSHKL